MPLKNSLNKIEAVWKDQEASHLDALLIENPIDLFYLTQLHLSAGSLLIFEKGAYLFLDGRYLEYAKTIDQTYFEVKEQSALKSALLSFSHIGFDQQWTSYGRWQTLKGSRVESLIPLKAPVQRVRAVKDAHELELLQRSAKLNWRGFEHIKSSLREGATEKELSKQFELFCLENGAEKMAFDPIIAFGKNSAYPHYRGGLATLQPGDSIICDVGVVVGGYHSDMTRTLFWKEPDPLLLKVEEAVHVAYQQALKRCHIGVEVGSLDDVVREVMKERGLDPYLVHSLGHGVGLDIHEYPRIRSQGEDHFVKLQENMVITIEPGLYLPGVGGYRFENTLVITQDGPMNFYPE
ncbi:MAG: Xaa-Pro peptidase family protein [Candidatus Rhabdochlamydia sp.]